MRNSKYSGLKAAMLLCVICVFAIMTVCVLVLIFPSMLSHILAAALGMVICVALLAFLGILYFRSRREIKFFMALIDNFEDIGFIRYDKNKGKGIASGKIKRITGVEIPGRIRSTDDYESLLDELYRRNHDFEEDIYSSPDGSNWYRLSSNEAEGITFTTIRDMTEYVEKTNIINNLRFYDSLTGMLNKKAVSNMLGRKVTTGYKSLGIAHFDIIGLEKIVSFEGAEAADDIITKLASCIKSFERSDSIFAGRTDSSGFTVILTQGKNDFDDYYEMIETILTGITETVNTLPEKVSQYIKVFCGYIICRGGETDTAKMLATAEFAAFDAQKKGSGKPVKYDSASYKESANEFKKIQIFNNIVSDGLIDYHFQPIVSARTGDIYGYEALMRPHELEGVRLSPLDMLYIAQEQNVLERIEKITFSKALKALSEHQELFHDKRLFVNSVSCVTLSETEYEELVETYGELFSKLVVEITEANKLSEEIVPVLNKFFKPRKAHVALDDYGAGYSNDKTLLDVMPNYIKIDRSLITDINSDENKKQLVSNIISYAATHGVYSLAEGVETEEELETVIFLGVDLIQGYVACRPVPIFMHEIAEEIKNLIVKFSIMHARRDDKIFEVKDDTPVDLVNLAVFGYTDVIVRCSNAAFYGEASTVLDMRIICQDDMQVLVKFKDVNIHHDAQPALEVGSNCAFTLHLEGNNTLSKQGIRVPETSRFILNGEGNLTIDCSFQDGVCLGGNSLQRFGRIDLDSTGVLSLATKCDRCVCLGGGIGAPDSVININSGRLTLHARGLDAVGIGTHEGDAVIMMNECVINADVSGVNVVAAGSINGCTELRSSADISITGAGDNCCLIGTAHGERAKVQLNKGSVKLGASGSSIIGIGSVDGRLNFGSSADMELTAAGDSCCLIGTNNGRSSVISIDEGNVKITCNAKNIVGIGTIAGQCDIVLSAGIYDILCEGNTAVCVGNIEGSGSIELGVIVMNAVGNSSLRQCIATGKGKITVKGGNIKTNSIDEIEAYNPYGTKLVCLYKEGSDELAEMGLEITDNGMLYRHVAKRSPLFEGYYLFLPDIE